jgi:hypothetical protein
MAYTTGFTQGVLSTIGIKEDEYSKIIHEVNIYTDEVGNNFNKKTGGLDSILVPTIGGSCLTYSKTNNLNTQGTVKAIHTSKIGADNATGCLVKQEVEFQKGDYMVSDSCKLGAGYNFGHENSVGKVIEVTTGSTNRFGDTAGFSFSAIGGNVGAGVNVGNDIAKFKFGANSDGINGGVVFGNEHRNMEVSGGGGGFSINFGFSM